MELNKILKKAIAESGIPISRISESSGVSRQHIYKIVSGDKNLSIQTLQKICDAINISPASLYENLDEKTDECVKIPVFSNLTEDMSFNLNENIIGYENIQTEIARNGNYFAIKMKDSSMSPTIQSGDLLIARKQDHAENGNICLAFINGNLVIREIKNFPEGILLFPHSPTHEFVPSFYSIKEIEQLHIKIMGIVTEIRRSLV